jgi:hypothetical protein
LSGATARAGHADSIAQRRQTRQRVTPLPDPLAQTIVATASALVDAHDPWWIISSAAAALHGAQPITVGDVDVILSPYDATRLFARLGIAPLPPSDHPRFRSGVFGRWTVPPLVVEFMAGFDLRDADGVWRRVAPQTREARSIGAATVFVPGRDELRAMFERFGRTKDQARIALLDQIG